MAAASARRAARQGRLDRARVVEAARELLDLEGARGFSMGRLGERLGVTAMALYRHVADRRDLENAVAERVLGDLAVEAPLSGDWAADVEAWMRGIREHLRRHPWLGALLGDRSQRTPPWLAALDRLAQILERAGLPPREVAREVVRISRATTGAVVLELAAPLPHAAALGSRMLEGLRESGRARWRPLVRYMARYGDDELFDDLVAETLARLRVQAAAR